jgi:hypothetical protein
VAATPGHEATTGLDATPGRDAITDVDATTGPEATTGLDATPRDVTLGDEEGVSDAPNVDRAEVSTADVTIDTDVVAVAPVFSPPPGTYAAPQSVTMTSSTPKAVIYYTTDGTRPTPASRQYTSPAAVTAGSTVFRAYTVASGFLDSPVTTALYSIGGCEAVPPPQPSPPAGVQNNDFRVALGVTRCGATTPTICYSLDGSMPTANSGLCIAPSTTYDPSAQVAIDGTVTNPNTGEVTLNAVAASAGALDSPMPPQTYQLRVATPTILPASGMITTGTAVSWTSPTVGATFHYTVDGTQATCSSPSAGTGFVATGVEKAVSVVGCKAGYAPSTAASATYSF